jgi:hypothetical protein
MSYASKHTVVGVSVELETAAKLRAVASAQSRSVSSLVNLMIEEALAKIQGRPIGDPMARSLEALQREDVVWNGKGKEGDEL